MFHAKSVPTESYSHCYSYPFLIVSMQETYVHKRHVLSDSPLRVLRVNLVDQPVQEPMHLVDGGVIKQFLECLLYSGPGKHKSRLATINQHRMSATDYGKLRVIFRYYKRLQLDEFPRKMR
jgi:hypothetical protein